MNTMPITFKSFYGRSEEDKVDVWVSDEPSQTLQEFKDEADINNLVARYKQTGAFYDALAARNLGVQPRVPIFEDVSEIPDFAAAQEVINQGKEAFAALPPSVRSAFSNSPDLFLAFMTENAKNPEALRKVGLLAAQQTQSAAGVQGIKSPATVETAPQQSAGASENASE
ncbi:internal scaffolding protein [Chicken microvirus mg5_146]|nr:internal scaffolding protein [Chicken microvirus mg5_146]